MRDGSLSALMARNVPDEIMKMAEEHSDGESSRMFYCQILYKVQKLLKVIDWYWKKPKSKYLDKYW